MSSPAGLQQRAPTFEVQMELGCRARNSSGAGFTLILTVQLPDCLIACGKRLEVAGHWTPTVLRMERTFSAGPIASQCILPRT